MAHSCREQTCQVGGWGGMDWVWSLNWYVPHSDCGLASIGLSSVQFRSVAQSCPTHWEPLDCSTPGLPVHHQLPERAQTHVHRVGDGSSCLILAGANSRLWVHSDLFHVHLHSSSFRSCWRHFLVVDAQSTRTKPNQQAHLMLLLHRIP